MRHVLVVLLAASCCASVSACASKTDDASPIATPAVTIARSAAAIGSPIDMRYRFTVSRDMKPVADDYVVFVHFLDKDGELLWADDHPPATPVRAWKPGAVIEYSRTMFVPKVSYTGQTNVEIGLYAPKTGARLPLQGQSAGMRSYRVAKLNLGPQNGSDVVIFASGWHDTETADGGALEWQWSKKQSYLSFRNPKRDSVLLLEADQPAALPQPQTITLKIGFDVVDTFRLPPNDRTVRRVNLSAAQLGSGDTVDVAIDVDPTFVPATMPELKSRDIRTLGVRVFRAYIQPK